MTQAVTPTQRITTALAEARKARHHKNCHCRHFDGNYCNPADALWQRAINRELDTYNDTARSQQ